MARHKIVVVGVGALGSHFILNTRNFSDPIVVIDDDVVEKKNVLSQFFGSMGVRKKKVVALQGIIQLLFGRKIETVAHRLTEDNVEVLLAEAKLIVDCLDNRQSREILQRYSELRGVPCLHGALSAAEHSFGRIGWENFLLDEDAGEGIPTCEDGETLPFISVVAAQMATVAQLFLTSGKKASMCITPTRTIPM